MARKDCGILHHIWQAVQNMAHHMALLDYTLHYQHDMALPVHGMLCYLRAELGAVALSRCGAVVCSLGAVTRWVLVRCCRAGSARYALSRCGLPHGLAKAFSLCLSRGLPVRRCRAVGAR